MNIVIPMAGFGERFSKAGFKDPKPLIPIIDKPMYRYVVDALPLCSATNVVFILKQDDFTAQIVQDIHLHYAYLEKYTVITLPQPTRGQAETVLLSMDALDHTVPTLIHNCDTYIQNQVNWNELLQEDIDGAIVLFASEEPRWSYARIDESSSLITEFKEKKVISTHASTGTYYFKDTLNLIDAIRHIIKLDIKENNEFYLSTVYQLMIEQQKKIKPYWIDTMLCFGTPQDLVFSLNQLLIKVNE